MLCAFREGIHRSMDNEMGTCFSCRQIVMNLFINTVTMRREKEKPTRKARRKQGKARQGKGRTKFKYMHQARRAREMLYIPKRGRGAMIAEDESYPYNHESYPYNHPITATTHANNPNSHTGPLISTGLQIQMWQTMAHEDH